jgi:F-type H+-transporting ATPase subunit b
MEVSISAIIAQVINFWIIFWLFSKFAAKPLANAIEDRKKLLKKLEDADKVYEDKLEAARLEAKEIVQDWMKRKEKLIFEAGLLADKKRDEILLDTKKQSEKIIQAAETKSKMLQTELEKSFSDWVKRTSLLVVKKLIQNDKEIKKDYLDQAISEVIKN